jgi:3-amino-5-hydroxybenzoate synthase
MAVFAVGARPIPVDVDPSTWCIDSEAVRSALGPRTRAIIPVHFAGHPADVDALAEVCAPQRVTLIEDAAHAHGAVWKDRPVGSLSLMAAFSFQNFKLMTAGEGGFLIVNDDDLYGRAFLVANRGRPVGDTTYQHLTLGSNFRMGEFQGAVLNAQLSRLAEQGELRETNAAHLRQRLAEIPGVGPQGRALGVSRHAYYMFVLTFDADEFGGIDRQTLVEALVAEGVPAFRMYPRVQDTQHFHPALASVGGDPTALPPAPVSQGLGEQGIWIHHRALLGDLGLTDQIAEAFAKVRSAAAKIRRWKAKRS